MPSRIMVGLIITVWLAVMGYVFDKQIWPRYFGDRPPGMQVDLVDEATQRSPTYWTISRQDKPIGSLTTQMVYQEADDTFQFVNSYSKLQIEMSKGVTIELPKLVTTVRVTRQGDLREQSMKGELVAKFGMLEVGNAGAEVEGQVVNGELRGRCQVRYPLSRATPNIDRELEPVPVPSGQIMNPLMPVNRLRDIHPGKRWVIQEVDPLKDAIGIMFREMLKESKMSIALPTGQESNRELLAEVLPDIVEHTSAKGTVTKCRIIEYRREGLTARTWVSIDFGNVLRQEASSGGEQLRFERRE
ncbi:MAG: hypothetical protein ACRC8S_08650 [Fimbriiglobus sp.]